MGYFRCEKCGKIYKDIYARYHEGKEYCKKCWNEIAPRGGRDSWCKQE